MEPREAVAPIPVEAQSDRASELSNEKKAIPLVVDMSCIDTGLPSKHVHHRDFPEIRGVGGSIRECVIQLTFQLARAREHARESWQRDAIDLAILDVNTFRDSDSVPFVSSRDKA